MTYVPRGATKTLAAVVLLVLTGAVSGCAARADDPRSAAPAVTSGGSGTPHASGSPGGEARAFCPEDAGAGSGADPSPAAAPSPCITYSWEQRVAENHAYRDERPLTDAQRAEARPKAEALAAALKKLDGGSVTEDRLRAAVAGALGLPPLEIEFKETRANGGSPKQFTVGAGAGERGVCVKGTLDTAGEVGTEVSGRTMDGTCLPGEGGH
ncbi:precorrin-3B C(17)-methyltransferase [Streptomyces corynorhini]|uniref:Precorrin-3B C(17)-methyltransferase n=1 Tax=Streptomyces corynorhini TaxID=2282652 RepID=A0A370B411_9ACTN|nr:precorrin-3B C(17)-methyltransferase [Streptomyces corynorhini]RDG34476.1 precorrin-3B C(17)-methyltransferase [Streptomyces corynorhini]